MTDGPSLQIGILDDTLPSIDLINYAAWLDLQPVSTIAGILDLTANELYRRGMFAASNEIKHVVAELRA